MRSKVAIHSRAQAVSEFITIEHQDLNEAIEEANHGASKLLFPKRQSRIRVFRHEYLVVFVYPGEDGKCVLFDDEKRADFVSHLRAEELVPIALDPDDIIAVYDKFGSLDLYEILWLHSGTSDWVRKP
ncbi:hypothetical protein KQI84_11570 [bacterium]|nr:hypothetical protein [bacterium]